MARRWLSRPGRNPAPDVAMVPAGLPPPAPGPVTAAAPGGCYTGIRVCSRHGAKPPPALESLPDDAMVAVASVPGKRPEEWQDEGARPFWIAWPHAAGADAGGCAEVMTAGQLRALLAARDNS